MCVLKFFDYFKRRIKKEECEDSKQHNLEMCTERVKAESLPGKFLILIAKVFFPYDNSLEQHGTH